MMASSDLVTVGEFVFGAGAVVVTAVFGWPAWKLARRSERRAEADDERERVANLAAAVARYLGVPLTDAEPPDVPVDLEHPTPQNPSVLDLLTEIRDYQEEQSALALIVAFHQSDRHGPEIPRWVLEAQRERQARHR